MNKFKYFLMVAALSLAALISGNYCSKDLNLRSQASALYFSSSSSVSTFLNGVGEWVNEASKAFGEALTKIKTAAAIAKARLEKAASGRDAQHLNSALGGGASAGAQRAELLYPLPVRPTLTLPTGNDAAYAANLAKSLSRYVAQARKPARQPATKANIQRMTNLQVTTPAKWTDDDVYFLMSATDVRGKPCQALCGYASAARDAANQKNADDFATRIVAWQQTQRGYLNELFIEGQYVMKVFFTLSASLSETDKAVLQKATTDLRNLLSDVVAPPSS